MNLITKGLTVNDTEDIEQNCEHRRPHLPYCLQTRVNTAREKSSELSDTCTLTVVLQLNDVQKNGQ